jgi:hypothetical protein
MDGEWPSPPCASDLADLVSPAGGLDDLGPCSRPSARLIGPVLKPNYAGRIRACRNVYRAQTLWLVMSGVFHLAMSMQASKEAMSEMS